VSCSSRPHLTREIRPGIVLDARRAVWLTAERTLLVADLHLGYAWAQRSAGELLPITPRSETLPRLAALLEDYQPARTVLLGDIVHDAVDISPLTAELRQLHAYCANRSELILIAGNHDRQLHRLLFAHSIDLPLVRELSIGPHRLVHGDGIDADAARAELAIALHRGGFVFCGHEHPAITLSDRVASYAKCPCFVEGDGLLMLPAFSEWAAGNSILRREHLSSYLQAAEIRSVTAIVAGKLLTVPWGGRR
jgi:putative SbcD/Mre11-related phosphoesterase